MPTAHHARIRLADRRPPRRASCRTDAPAWRFDRLYTGLLEPGGVWTLYAGTTLLVSVTGEEAPRVLVAAMLADAFPGRSIRPDLIDAFLAAWDPPDGSFVLPTDLVAGWSLRWALDQPAAD